MNQYEVEIVEASSNRVVFKVAFDKAVYSIADVIVASVIPEGCFARINGQKQVA
jgi:hypothetical protein